MRRVEFNQAVGSDSAGDGQGGGKAPAAPAMRLAHSPSTRLEARSRGVGTLAPYTRRWLHIDQYGEAVAPDVDLDQHVAMELGCWSFYSNVVYNLFAEPGSSRAATAYSLVMTAVILLSTISFLLSTVHSIDERHGEAFDWIEGVTVVCFTVDYIIR